VSDWYEPPPEDDYEPEPIGEQREAQPDDFCECRPGVELRNGWQHDPTCLRWTPPLTGPGSTDAHRAKVLAYCRTVIADARQRHQEGKP
jgi:hypothetical protein